MDFVGSKQPNGAGVLLFENYKCKKTGRRGIALILFGSIRKAGFVYSDCGGSIEKGERVELCAARELQEETSNLFCISPGFLTKSVQHRSYVCFLVFVHSEQGIRTTDFNQNTKIITRIGNAPSAWRESKAIRRFFIEDLVKQRISTATGHHIPSINSLGEKVLLHSRIVGVIRQVLVQGIVNFKTQTVAAPSCQLRLKEYLPSSKQQFLKNTKQFEIVQVFKDIESSEKYQLNIWNNPQNVPIENQNQPLLINPSVALHQHQNQELFPNDGIRGVQNGMEIEEKFNLPFGGMKQEMEVEKDKQEIGVLILAIDETSNYQGVILLKTNSGEWSDIQGNKLSINETESTAALRIVKQKLANVISVQENQLKVSISLQSDYQCYVICIKVNTKQLILQFRANQNSIQNSGGLVPNDWNITQEIQFFPLKCFNQLETFEEKFQIEQFITKNNINKGQAIRFIDQQGGYQIIQEKTLLILKQIIQQGLTQRMYWYQYSLNNRQPQLDQEYPFLSKSQQFVCL